MYSLQLSTTLGQLNARGLAKNHNIRTIRRIAITLVVVNKHAGFGTWFPRPARIENVLVFVLPEYHSWMDPFCNLNDDFVPLRGARERVPTECDCSTDRRHGVNSLHDGVPPEHPGNPGREPIDVHISPFCGIWMHAEWLCYNEICRIVRLFVQRLCHPFKDLLLPAREIFVLVFTHCEVRCSQIRCYRGEPRTL